MVVVAGWMADERTTDHAQIVFKSHNECSKETTFRGKVVAENENLSFTAIESFSQGLVRWWLLRAGWLMKEQPIMHK
jgi:glucose dehydrogenase